MHSVLIGAVASTATALDALVDCGAAPAMIVTLPPSRAGRHSDFVNVAPIAHRHGVGVVEAQDVNDTATVAVIRDLQPDVIWVIGWSQLLRRELLGVGALGAVGFHPAALPRNRGRAVIPWTILQHDTTTAATLLWLDEGVDSGDIAMQHTFDVAPDEIAATLYAKHLAALRSMIPVLAAALERGERPARAQDHSQATYCARRVAADGLIDWTSKARDVWTLIRAVGDPYPGAFTFVGSQRLSVWDASLVAGTGGGCGGTAPGSVQRIDERGAVVLCGDGRSVRITTCQLDDGPRVRAAELLRCGQHVGNSAVAVQRTVAGIPGS